MPIYHIDIKQGKKLAKKLNKELFLYLVHYHRTYGEYDECFVEFSKEEVEHLFKKSKEKETKEICKKMLSEMKKQRTNKIWIFVYDFNGDYKF